MRLLKSLMVVMMLLFTTQVAVVQASTDTIQTQEQAKELEISEDDVIILGVAGGIGEYFNIDADVVRIGFVLLSLLFGCGLLAYIVCYVIMIN